MEDSSNKLYWVIGGIIIAVAIVLVAKAAFPTLATQVTTYLSSQISSLSGK